MNMRNAIVIGLVLASGTAAQAMTVNTGVDASATTMGNAALRFRNFGGSNANLNGAGEVYVGKSDIGGGMNRVEQQQWWTGGNKSFSLSYNPGTNTLTTTVGGTTSSYSATFTDAIWNYIQITVKVAGTSSNNAAISLTDLKLNNTTIGSGTFAGVLGQNKDWNVTGLGNLKSTGFTLTGMLNFSGAFSSSQEASAVNFRFGNVASVVPLPAAAWAGLSGLVGVAGLTVARRRKISAQ